MDNQWPDALESEPRKTVSLVIRQDEAVAEKPLPEPLYDCCICYEYHTWPADDLWWSDYLQGWCCTNCWDEVPEHWHGNTRVEAGISLAKELKRRGLNR